MDLFWLGKNTKSSVLCENPMWCQSFRKTLLFCMRVIFYLVVVKLPREKMDVSSCGEANHMFVLFMFFHYIGV